ncbi:MAG TPA: sorbosone dehydrogenase family protein [Gemmatimonadaceae bacterium]|nr:sorbosone dehydrogenase family protein [Gemmatimonadaceae bacterium]
MPIASTTGPTPTIPEPTRSKIPTVNVAKVVGWSGKDHPVAVPGTTVNAFADKLDHPRWLHVLPNGDVLVAETNAPDRPEMRTGLRGWFLRMFMHEGGAGDPSANRITLLRDADGDGVAELRSPFITNLNSPFGMALVGNRLYVANTDAVVSFPYTTGQIQITASPTRIVELPAGPINHHWTRGLIASPDGSKLYVSAGSNSDWGERGMEHEVERASILEIDPRTGTKRVYASGMRDPVGMEWVPGANALWVVVNERKGLGSDVPPDYMTEVREDGFYGWPYSYHGKHLDPRVKPQRPDLVAKAITPDYALGAHTASLGIAWAGVTRLPARFHNGMIVTQYGSWNRIPRSGYRVVFVPFTNGKPSGQPFVLLTGFLDDDENAQGRPVGVAIDKRGSVLIADDAGNRVWRVTGAAPVVSAAIRETSLPLAQRFATRVELTEERGAAIGRNSGEQSIDRKCVDVNQSPNAKSGNFAVAGFSVYAATWQQKQGNLLFKPTIPQPGVALTIRAEPLEGSAAAVEYKVLELSGSISEGTAAYPVKMQLPARGSWIITATAGNSFGCFIYTLR